MAAPKKSGLLIEVGMGKSKPSMREEEAELSEHDVAADEVFDALKSGDRQAFREALQTFVEACTSGHSEPDGDEAEEY